MKDHMATYKYFTGAFALTAIGLALGAFLGWNTSGTWGGALQALFICAVLGVLEISLSFDNAIVNANKLKDMDAVWRRRFLTWGIVIAVFGMRVVFPLLIVAVTAHLGPAAALDLAITKPAQYAEILLGAHVSIAAFGGTFLLMVALSFFFDEEKEVHWVHFIEDRLARVAGVKGVEVFFVLAIVLAFSAFLDKSVAATFLYAAVWGLAAFLAVELLGSLLDASQEVMSVAAKGGIGTFLYLEMLDASFSFDGVIGAFALSTNLFIIAIGLGIGAMYVRSMTIMLVDRGTLNEYRYLEHGAFYAIFVLAVLMFLQTMVHVPEVVTGLFGAGLIVVAYWSSVRWKKANPEGDDAVEEALQAAVAAE
jgi:hypothetical protein